MNTFLQYADLTPLRNHTCIYGLITILYPSLACGFSALICSHDRTTAVLHRLSAGKPNQHRNKAALVELYPLRANNWTPQKRLPKDKSTSRQFSLENLTVAKWKRHSKDQYTINQDDLHPQRSSQRRLAEIISLSPSTSFWGNCSTTLRSIPQCWSSYGWEY